MPEWKDFYRELRASEGSVSHMYLDTTGHVTVGVGSMLPSVRDAQSLPFQVRETRRPATREQIATDYAEVSKRQSGLRASAYRSSTKLELTDKAIGDLFRTKVAWFKSRVASEFTGLDSYPITVQFALVDMAFNLGVAGLLKKFPTFVAHIRAKKWEDAARESNRIQVSGHRNQQVRDWLTEAAK